MLWGRPSASVPLCSGAGGSGPVRRHGAALAAGAGTGQRPALAQARALPCQAVRAPGHWGAGPKPSGARKIWAGPRELNRSRGGAEVDSTGHGLRGCSQGSANHGARRWGPAGNRSGDGARPTTGPCGRDTAGARPAEVGVVKGPARPGGDPGPFRRLRGLPRRHGNRRLRPGAGWSPTRLRGEKLLEGRRERARAQVGRGARRCLGGRGGRLRAPEAAGGGRACAAAAAGGGAAGILLRHQRWAPPLPERAGHCGSEAAPSPEPAAATDRSHGSARSRLRRRRRLEPEPGPSPLPPLPRSVSRSRSRSPCEARGWGAAGARGAAQYGPARRGPFPPADAVPGSPRSAAGGGLREREAGRGFPPALARVVTLARRRGPEELRTFGRPGGAGGGVGDGGGPGGPSSAAEVAPGLCVSAPV